jgi:predicted Zn-ribbon and HTH transcriptional regulator
LGHGLWGLNDRDIPLNQDQQRMLVEQLVAALQSRGEGIHVSELSSVLNNSDYLACTPQALLSIATQDPQLTANVGKYLYLAAWGHARRENVIDALRATLEQARSPLTIDEVVARVETRLKRGIVRTSIYSRMQAIGAKYEPATQTWALPEANDTAEEEFIDADSVGAE